MIAWKPMVVYGGPNYLHRPWGPAKPNSWGRTHPVAWGPPQQTNIETSGFDAPNDSDYLDDYEQGNFLKGMTTVQGQDKHRMLRHYRGSPPYVDFATYVTKILVSWSVPY